MWQHGGKCLCSNISLENQYSLSHNFIEENSAQKRNKKEIYQNNNGSCVRVVAVLFLISNYITSVTEKKNITSTKKMHFIKESKHLLFMAIPNLLEKNNRPTS